jgi:hypothetical protein
MSESKTNALIPRTPGPDFIKSFDQAEKDTSYPIPFGHNVKSDDKSPSKTRVRAILLDEHHIIYDLALHLLSAQGFCQSNLHMQKLYFRGPRRLSLIIFARKESLWSLAHGNEGFTRDK